MNKKIVAADYKVSKDWSTAMQQFSSPSDTASDVTDTETKKMLPTSPSRKNKNQAVQIPTWLPRTAMFTACALILGNIPLQSSHKAFQLDHTNNITSPPQQQPVITAIENKAQEIKEEPHERKTLTEQLTLPQAPILLLSVAENATPKTFIDDNWTTHTVSGEETIQNVFKKLGIKSECELMTTHSKKIAQNLDRLAKNDLIRIEKIDGKLTQLITYKRGDKKSFVIRKRNNRYTSSFRSRVIETRQARKTLFIKKSLHDDANQENISRKLVKQFIKIFDRDLKLASDLKKGDRVTLVFEELFHKGSKIGSSDILAAELTHNKRSHRAIRYIQSDRTVKYLDADGRDLDQAFKRRALKHYKRISSHFGSRHHPIYKRSQNHHGTDYAAPRGTPISATGNGIITHVARKGGYGKTVEIKHRDGYVTRYAHMNNYAKDLKVGKKVFLGDTIGYVGSTGSSTGDHLHYEFRLNGRPLNPETTQLPKFLSLAETEHKRFRKNTRNLVRQLNILQRFAKEKVDISIGFGG